MRHLFVISGNATVATNTRDRIQDFLRSTYSNPVIRQQLIGEEQHANILISAASDESLLPGVYVDASSDSWLITLGAWFNGKNRASEISRSISDVCRAGDLLEHPALHGVDGAFCIIAGSIRQKSLTVITDRIGTQHIYAQQTGDSISVSTSSLALAAISGAQWDRQGVQEFLATGTIFGEKTLFESIDKLAAATQTSFSVGTPKKIKKYWTIADSFTSVSEQPAIERLAGALESSILSATQQLGTPVLSLTGGLDSRIIFATALNAGISFEVFTTGNPASADVVIARKIARRFGIKHHLMDPVSDAPMTNWARIRKSFLLCDGECDALEYTTTLGIHERLSSQFDFSINGSGGEFCKGYWWELLWPQIGKTIPLDIANVIDKRFVINDRLSGLLATPANGARATLIETAEKENAGILNYPNTLQMDNVYLTLRMQRWQGRIASATNQIWPTISPFMLQEPMEIAFSTPPNQRIRNRMSRRLNEYANPALARMPIDQRGPALPLRPDTAHLFLGSATALADKVATKLWSKFPLRRHDRRDKAIGTSRSHIENFEGLSQFSDIGRWQTLNLYNHQKLDGFVGDYFTNRQPIDKAFGRLITLECVARQLTDELPD